MTITRDAFKKERPLPKYTFIGKKSFGIKIQEILDLQAKQVKTVNNQIFWGVRIVYKNGQQRDYEFNPRTYIKVCNLAKKAGLMIVHECDGS